MFLCYCFPNKTSSLMFTFTVQALTFVLCFFHAFYVFFHTLVFLFLLPSLCNLERKVWRKQEKNACKCDSLPLCAVSHLFQRSSCREFLSFFSVNQFSHFFPLRLYTFLRYFYCFLSYNVFFFFIFLFDCCSVMRELKQGICWVRKTVEKRQMCVCVSLGKEHHVKNKEILFKHLLWWWLHVIPPAVIMITIIIIIMMSE